MNYLENATEKLFLDQINRMPEGDDNSTEGGSGVELPPDED